MIKTDIPYMTTKWVVEPTSHTGHLRYDVLAECGDETWRLIAEVDDEQVAKLIAAVPDMLEALRHCNNYFQRVGWLKNSVIGQTVQIALEKVEK